MRNNQTDNIVWFLPDKLLHNESTCDITEEDLHLQDD